MGMHKMKFGVILAMVMMSMLSSACVPGAEQPPASTGPSGNQAPKISSLTLAQPQVYPSRAVEIRCDATDSDGDTISYEWSCTGGKFSGTGTPVVSWIAPEELGDYNIKVTVKDGKGGITQDTITIKVVRNLDPEIMSLVASPDTVLPNGKSTITCAAKDPDGDELEYTWSAIDGTITGVGDTVTWIAPDREGEFSIIVIVGDGKGGQNRADVPVTARRTQKTIILSLVPSETGTVSSEGDKDNSKIMAGDNDKNVGYRAFFSFDISQLIGTDVKEAKLTFTTGNVEGKPLDRMTELYGLQLYSVRGVPGELPDYDPVRYPLANVPSIMWEPPTVIDVTPAVKGALLTSEYNVHLHFGASFPATTNGDGMSNYISWSTVTLTVTYAEK